MTQSEIEIYVGDVSDVEARVYARYRGSDAERGPADREQILLRGTLQGPYCERTHTLPAEFPFRDQGPGPTPLAEAVVPDPCTWSPDLPHLYRADVEARQGEQVVAEYHGMIGLRRKQ